MSIGNASSPRLEGIVSEDFRLLATIMGLPLIDGVFPALVLAGALSGATGVFEVGLLVFGGAATLAVVLVEMSGGPRRRARVVLGVGAVLTAGAATVAALAPTIQGLLALEFFQWFAAGVVLVVAAKTARAPYADDLPGPGPIVGAGLAVSLRPAGFELAVASDPALVAKAGGAALVGTAFALTVAVAGPYLRENVDVDRLRVGSALALALLGLSIVGAPLGDAPTVVLAAAVLFALDPASGGQATRTVSVPVPGVAIPGGRRSPSLAGTAANTDDATTHKDATARAIDARLGRTGLPKLRFGRSPGSARFPLAGIHLLVRLALHRPTHRVRGAWRSKPRRTHPAGG